MLLFARAKSAARLRRRHLRAETLETRALLTTFYVDADLGSPGNNGSAEAPFAQINQGIHAAMLNDGADEVVIMPRSAGGVYDESISLDLHGTDDSPILLRGATGDANDVVLTSSTGPGILVDKAVELTIRDLKIEGTELAGIRITSDANVLVDNVQVLGSRTNSGIAHQNGDLTVRNSYLAKSYQGLWSAPLLDSANAVIALPGNLVIENTIATDNAAQGILTRYSSGDVALVNVQATGNQMNGLRIWQTESISISGGEFSDNGYSGISVQDTNSPTIVGAVIANNSHDGIWSMNAASLNVRESEVVGNTRTGIYVNGSANAAITNTLVANNGWHGIKIDNANGVLIDGVTAESNGTIDGNYSNGGGGIGIVPATSAPIVISNSNIRNNETRGNGGGVEVWANLAANRGFLSEVFMSETVVAGNMIAPDVNRHGGGIALFGSVNATLENVQVEGNTARGTAGLHAFTAFSTPQGFPTLVVSDSVIAGNVALPEGPGIGAGSAGMYHGNGWLRMSGTTISGNNGGNAGGAYLYSMGGEIVNSTISGNEGAIVGGVNSRVGRSPLRMRHVTVVENKGREAGGIVSAFASLSVGNSIVAKNVKLEPVTHGQLSDGFASDLAGVLTSDGGNLFGEADSVQITSSTGLDLVGTQLSPLDPLLEPLADNGGSTLTHAPVAGSPVIGAGLNALVGDLSLDQRGEERVQDGVVDIGAVEKAVVTSTVDPIKGRINLNSADKGKKTVSLVLNSTDELDASSIDVSSVAWASANAVKSRLQDVDGDGDLDLILDFLLNETDLVDRYRDALASQSSETEVTVDVPLDATADDGTKVLGTASIDLMMTGKSLRDLLASI